MPSNYTTIIHADIPVLSSEIDSSRGSNLFRHIISRLWVNERCNILSVLPTSLPLDIHIYFPDITEVPLDDSLAALWGILGIKIQNNQVYLYCRGFHLRQ